MPKENRTTLKLAHSLYDSQSIESALAEFAELAEVAMVKYPTYSEISFANFEDANLPAEFANYVLFLTIQTK